MFRISTRELLWLTTIAALAIGWLIQSHSEQTENQFLQIQLMDQRLEEAEELVRELRSLAKHEAVAGVKQVE